MTEASLQGLLPPPSSAIRFKKVLWYAANVVAHSTDYLQYTYGMQMRTLPTLPGDPPADEWRRFVFTWDDTSSTVGADVAIHTVDVVNYTGGVLDSSWTTQDHQDVAGALINDFVAWITVHVQSRFTLTSVKAYRMAFTPMPTEAEIAAPGFKDEPFAGSGPPTWIGPQTIAGTGANNAAQVCSAITEETPVRRHWGRFYSPPLAAPSSTTGRWATASVNLWAQSWNNALVSLAAKDFYTVVPSVQVHKQPTRALQNVTGIHVDDVPDIIRRRRPKYVIYRKHYDEATPT